MLVGGQEFYTFSDPASHEKGNSQSIFLKLRYLFGIFAKQQGWVFFAFISLGISWDKFHPQYLDWHRHIVTGTFSMSRVPECQKGHGHFFCPKFAMGTFSTFPKIDTGWPKNITGKKYFSNLILANGSPFLKRFWNHNFLFVFLNRSSKLTVFHLG